MEFSSVELKALHPDPSGRAYRRHRGSELGEQAAGDHRRWPVQVGAQHERTYRTPAARRCGS